MEVFELKVRLHCKACEKAIQKELWKIKGITCVETNVILNKITVMGYVDLKIIMKAIRKTGRKTEVWSSKQKEQRSRGYGCFIVPRCVF
nr:heavy metal-associated isoprenylated plant protein 30-like isoform X1 [Coffea arabica]